LLYTTENAPPIPPQSFRELDSAHPDDEHEHIPDPSVISGQTTPAPEDVPTSQTSATILAESQPSTTAEQQPASTETEEQSKLISSIEGRSDAADATTEKRSNLIATANEPPSPVSGQTEGVSAF
jgi:hypothetical protein